MTKTDANLTVAYIATSAGHHAQAMLYINAARLHCLTDCPAQTDEIHAFAEQFRLHHFARPPAFGVAESL